MPQIVYTPEFISDFERIYIFLAEKNPAAAQRLANYSIKDKAPERSWFYLIYTYLIKSSYH